MQVDTQTGPASATSRQACFDSAEGFCDVQIFQRSALEADNTIEGPAIIEQPDTTTIVYPGDSAYVDEHNNLVMKIQPLGSR
jgi:N-methylhydantoinase A